MKLFHTADWHLGKLVHGVYMTEDQKIVLISLYRLLKKKTRCCNYCRDLYDRAIPPTEAVDLLNDVLQK